MWGFHACCCHIHATPTCSDLVYLLWHKNAFWYDDSIYTIVADNKFLMTNEATPYSLALLSVIMIWDSSILLMLDNTTALSHKRLKLLHWLQYQFHSVCNECQNVPGHNPQWNQLRAVCWGIKCTLWLAISKARVLQCACDASPKTWHLDMLTIWNKLDWKQNSCQS